MSGRSHIGARLRALGAVVPVVMALVIAGCAKKPVIAPVPPGAPRFPDFVFPSSPEGAGSQDVLDQHTAAWQLLQSGDPKSADRAFAAILKTAPSFYPAEAGLGYSALARRDLQNAIDHFDKALAGNAAYAPALAGKGDALLLLARTDAALEVFQAALTADPTLTALGSRVDVLKFRHAQVDSG